MKEPMGINGAPFCQIKETLIPSSLGAGIAGILTGTPQARAQSAAQQAPRKVIDFHNHFIGAAFTPIVGAGAPSARRAYFDAVNRNLADSHALLRSIEVAGIAARVVNTPLDSSRMPTGDRARHVMRINDRWPNWCGTTPGFVWSRYRGAFSGEEGARDTPRAVRELTCAAHSCRPRKNSFSMPLSARRRSPLPAALGVPGLRSSDHACPTA